LIFGSCAIARSCPGMGMQYARAGGPGRGDADASALEAARSAVLGLGVAEHEKGIWWMPWHREAMKDVARCEKLR
jgi:hypothetical protein